MVRLEPHPVVQHVGIFCIFLPSVTCRGSDPYVNMANVLFWLFFLVPLPQQPINGHCLVRQLVGVMLAVLPVS